MKRLRIIVCLFVLFVTESVVYADDTGRLLLERGNQLYEQGKYAEAVVLYKEAAELDETEAEFNLGYAYYNGEGTEKDYTTAVMWFKRAARKKFPKAEYNLAFCYMYGYGVPQDYEKALAYLRASAVRGYQQAQLTLSECYAHGVLVEQDKQEAAKWQAMADGTMSPQEDNTGDKSTENPPAPKEPKQREGIVLTRDGILGASAPETRPPVVKILYPEDQSLFHTDIVKLKYQLLANGLEGQTQVTVMVDGIKQPEQRAVRQANIIDVEVPNRDCTITLYAQNANGYSEPATVRLHRENVAQMDLPRLFCVAVGVGQYNSELLPNLSLTTKDARDFADVVQSKKGLPFSEVMVKVLLDKEAARGEIHEALKWMAQEARPSDLCIFFFAGHGYRDEQDRFYFIPYGGTIDKLYNCFSASEFKAEADKIHCKLIVFADACYSAALLDGYRSAATSHFIEQLRRSKNGMVLYASSSGDTKSKEDLAWGNGAFTKALVEAFNGAARREGDEGLATNRLDSWLYDEVRKITDYKQTPVYNSNGVEHFNIFIYEK